MEFWRKSSYSGGVDQDCVEIAANWHKSSYSRGGHQDCVEVAEASRQVKIRDTRHRDLGHLSFSTGEWTRFLRELKEQES